MYTNDLVVEDYQEITTIGYGAISRVKLMKHNSKKEVIVMKVLKKSDIISNNMVDKVKSEKKITKILNHKFIVNNIGFAQTASDIIFAMEFIPGGELFTHLRNVGKFQLNEVKFYSAQIILTLEYIHNNGIIYRDLKPENILIDYTGYLKLTDFSISKFCRNKTYTFCGTPEYIAPEIIMNRGHTAASDFWTLGILIYEMIIGIYPFYNSDVMVLYDKIIKGVYKFPKNLDANVKSLIKRLLVADVKIRYGKKKENGKLDIANHKFFKGFNWDALENMSLLPQYIPKIKGLEDTSNFPRFIDDIDEEDKKEGEVFSLEDDPFYYW